MDVNDKEILPGVKHVVLVLSGKGGVGKSTTAVQLALAFQALGKRVGVLDIDLCGPSIPKMMGKDNHEIHQCDQGWVPVYTDPSQTLGLMSIGFLLKSADEAVVWRGPKKNAMIKQFLTDTAWGEVDVLVVDTPPGTSDEHITVMENFKNLSKDVLDGAVLVTTPQALAVGDVRRELTFCKKAKLRVLGILENMSGYACPACHECTNIFSKGGGQALAEHSGVPFLGAVAIDPQLAKAAESGQNFVQAFKESPAAAAFTAVAAKIAAGHTDTTTSDN